jgi:hypothetical protein
MVKRSVQVEGEHQKTRRGILPGGLEIPFAMLTF